MLSLPKQGKLDIVDLHFDMPDPLASWMPFLRTEKPPLIWIFHPGLALLV
jgi:hypothetical protein